MTSTATGKKSVADLDVTNRRVLVRVDFNVPLSKAGKISDDRRIRAALPTIRHLIDHRAKVVLASHLGRPGGKPNPALTLRPVADRLAELLGRPVAFAADAVGPTAEAAVADLRPGDVLMLENVRFHKGEEANDPIFVQQLASLADLYVNDAFGTAHRAHASTVGVARLRPAAAGFLMQKELQALGGALEAPRRPFVAIVGGAKISSKIAVLNNLLGRVDQLLVGGGMANTFLRAKGVDVQRSLVEDDEVERARAILSQAGDKLVLPVDVVVAEKPEADAPSRTVPVDRVPAGWSIFDIGPETVSAFGQICAGAGTVIWNGPLGLFEVADFARGTLGVARALGDSKATTIVGGGDLVAALDQLGMTDRMSHVSTGGGASLEFLEGKELPGVAALNDR